MRLCKRKRCVIRTIIFVRKCGFINMLKMERKCKINDVKCINLNCLNESNNENKEYNRFNFKSS